MHTLHMVAVKVDAEELENIKEEACDDVESTLLGDGQPYATWYDWFVVGGGRFVEGDAYADNHDNAIAYHNEPEKFIAEMDKVLGWRKANANRMLDKLRGDEFDFIYAVETAVEGRGEVSNLWQALELAKIANGYWIPESHFFDLANGTTSNEYILKDIEEGRGHEWVLVPVDFHH